MTTTTSKTKAKVLFAAAELTPLAKSGGLADVVGALPIALRGLGYDTRIIIPRYSMIDAAGVGFRRTGEISVTVSEGAFPVGVWEGELPHSDVPVILLESEPFLSRGGIYFEQSLAEKDFSEHRRFLFFTRAIEVWLNQSTWQPDILHSHDWETGLLPILTEHKYKSILTLHNLAIQGLWNRAEVEGLLQLTPGSLPAVPGTKPDDVNILGIGILNHDFVTTVSPTYAQEIHTPEYGSGLETLIQQEVSKISGILNGIDVQRFNPETDAAIVQYNSDTLDLKQKNRQPLLDKFKLTGTGPLYGFVGRLTDQKGIDIVAETVETLRAQDANLIILGKGIKECEAMATTLAEQLPGRAGVVIGFDAQLAQQLYAGVDIMLVPSKFEPCGLVQMISLRYGTPALVRATGGLKDTVQDGVTGIVFKDYSATALAEALDRAAALWKDPAAYRRVQQAGMAQDFSWTHSAKAYADLYDRVLSAAAAA